MTAERREKKEEGFSMIEVLVSLLLVSIAALNICYSSMVSLKVYKRTVRNSLAAQLALEKIEELASTDPTTLSAGSTVESAILKDNISFSRTTQVTINADASRSVSVTVVGNVSSLGGEATLSDTLVPWSLS